MGYPRKSIRSGLVKITSWDAIDVYAVQDTLTDVYGLLLWKGQEDATRAKEPCMVRTQVEATQVITADQSPDVLCVARRVDTAH